MRNMNVAAYETVTSLVRIKKLTLTEHDILALSDTFLTRGFHDIHVSNFSFGRALLKQFLALLNCYGTIACLAVNYHRSGQDDTIDNLHEHLQKITLTSHEQALNDFLLNEFHYDFLWIEWSSELLHQPWCMRFKRKLIEFDLAHELPIVNMYAHTVRA